MKTLFWIVHPLFVWAMNRFVFAPQVPPLVLQLKGGGELLVPWFWNVRFASVTPVVPALIPQSMILPQAPETALVPPASKMV